MLTLPRIQSAVNLLLIVCGTQKRKETKNVLKKKIDACARSIRRDAMYAVNNTKCDPYYAADASPAKIAMLCKVHALLHRTA